MKVYDIETIGTYSQTHSVVADSMGEAERIFLGKYWPCDIKGIKLHSEYVQIQKWDEQAKDSGAISAQQTHGGQSVSQPAPNCLSATSPC